ncbi:unnamed protein product [Rhizoctonia solani]|uniref:Uncharacterized protein n=1 Tax=Rhizoctonia solani TaxID=456999 RepID=A0A8H2XR61_9AGAM|nr:unnamed protein product [Rhizoctonia solani]
MSIPISAIPSNLGVISASDTELEFDLNSGSQSDSDFEIVLVTQAATGLIISDSDSGSLVSAPSDLSESSDDEHIFVQNIARSAPNTPRPPSFVPPRLDVTPRPPAAIPRPIFEHGHDSEASDREDDSSTGSLYDSDSDADGSVAAHARARTVTITHDRLEAPVALHSTTSLGTIHGNGSAATIRQALPTATSTLRRSTPAGMHTPAITTNTIASIVASAPLSPPTPSDGGEIPYAPFTAAPTAVSVPVPIAVIPTPAPTRQPPRLPPPIPTASLVTRKMWSAMNTARMKLGFKPLEHTIRLQLNCDRKQQWKEEVAKKEAEKKAAKKAAKDAAQKKLAANTPPKSKKPKSKSKAKSKAIANPLVAPGTVVGSPVSSEDEAPRMRVSIFSPVNDRSEGSDSPDEEAYDEAIKQLDDHMLSPPEHPTAAYRYLLNRALLLEFRICTPDTLPTSHGAAIAMVKANVHVNVLDYIAKRKEGFSGLRSVMLANAKVLRKDVRKRRMPAQAVKSLGLHSLLIHH